MFRIVRARVSERLSTNQVLEFETVHERSVANAIAEIWSRRPEVKAGKEIVAILNR
jgi:hypothetical protein